MQQRVPYPVCPRLFCRPEWYSDAMKLQRPRNTIGVIPLLLLHCPPIELRETPESREKLPVNSQFNWTVCSDVTL